MRAAVVVGGGSWGTGFSRFLSDAGLDVTLATHHAEDAAAIRETGRNPRFMTDVDLSDVAATTVADAPFADADLVGVELCAAAKNVIALAAGACDGIGAGDNAKAALITRGLAEMARLGDAAGGQPDTFFGLAGMGDLIVTCWHPSGRNRRAGELIARGRTPEEAVAEIGQVVEGLTTAPVLCDLADRLGVELPIAESVRSVLEGASLVDLATSLMGRRPTDE